MMQKILSKAYQAMALLQEIGMDLSNEQKRSIAKMEQAYLEKVVIPSVLEETESLVAEMLNKFQLEVSYKRGTGLSIELAERKYVEQKLFQMEDTKERRKRKYILKVTFPDGQVSCHRQVWETLMDVVRYAGKDKVRALGFTMFGKNMISKQRYEDERYQAGQKEIEQGWYLCTVSSTDKKYEQILTINRSLQLGLNVEKVKK